MDDDSKRGCERWARVRFGVVGSLLAAPPPRGELQKELERLAEKIWRHPITGEPDRFGFSTIERWYYDAKNARVDPVAVLQRKVRKDAGQFRAIGPVPAEVLRDQYRDHPSWTYQLHADNLAAALRKQQEPGDPPSYPTVRRYMKAQGWYRRKRPRNADRPGVTRALVQLESREVRSYESEYVHGLWHSDGHEGSLKVVIPAGEMCTPTLIAVLDDHSRLCCHAQWYLVENSQNAVHTLGQAMQKRRLCRKYMSDQGAAFMAAEMTEGLERLGVVHSPTLPYSPHQNAKIENFWAQVEGRVLAMLENCRDLTLEMLNRATQAWVEMEYNRELHGETGQAPIERFLTSPSVGRPSPSSQELRLAFCTEVKRTQRRSDSTVSLEGVRFEVPSRYRHVGRLFVRYARWDLGFVHLVDERTGKVLAPIYPLDRQKNADGRRRALERPEPALPAPLRPGVAPLLLELMEKYDRSGLPPAYLAGPEPAPAATAPPPTSDEEENE
jgi:transposase InsO family protein